MNRCRERVHGIDNAVTPFRAASGKRSKLHNVFHLMPHKFSSEWYANSMCLHFFRWKDELHSDKKFPLIPVWHRKVSNWNHHWKTCWDRFYFFQCSIPIFISFGKSIFFRFELLFLKPTCICRRKFAIFPSVKPCQTRSTTKWKYNHKPLTAL